MIVEIKKRVSKLEKEKEVEKNNLKKIKMKLIYL